MLDPGDRVGEASALMRPLVDALERHGTAAEPLHADDTPVPVLAPAPARPAPEPALGVSA